MEAPVNFKNLKTFLNYRECLCVREDKILPVLVFIACQPFRFEGWFFVFTAPENSAIFDL